MKERGVSGLLFSFREGTMAPNSHVVKWLISTYRSILHRNHIKEAELASPECLRRPMEAVEKLEPRVMLASTTFHDFAKASYTGAPFITAPIKSAIVAGLGSFATQVGNLSDTPDFKSDVPGVLEYDQFFAHAPKAKALTDILNAVHGSTLTNIIQSKVVNTINALPINSGIAALN